MGAVAVETSLPTTNGVSAQPTKGDVVDAEYIRQKVRAVAQGFASTFRSPLLGSPMDYGLECEEISFPSQDGVPLEGWLIPRRGSHKLIVANHPRWFNRSGCPTNIEPWRSLGSWADPGNTVECNFLPDLKILHDAGYNVVTYDTRNHGQSGAGNGGQGSGGRFEARDVIGCLAYVRSRSDLRDMTLGIFARCLGANATLFAIHSQPDHFRDVRCVVAAQPLSIRAISTRRLSMQGVPVDDDKVMRDLDREIRLVTSLGIDDMTPTTWARSVHLPTFLYQVRNDPMTLTSDVQTVFDNLAAEHKKLHWIDGTTARWDGYLEFQRRPEPMLEWFATHMGS